MSDLKARLREVFRVEAAADMAALREALQGLRTRAPRPPAAEIEAFYRLAHKLKGACRAVNLTVARVAGHQIEYLFRALHESPSDLTTALLDDVAAGLEKMSAAIEAFAAGREEPADSELVARLNRHLEAAGSTQRGELPAASGSGPLPPTAPEPPARPTGPAIHPRILQSFAAEALEIMDGLRAAFARFPEAPPPVLAELLDDALRRAHTLKGSARVVKMDEVSSLAHELEDALRPLGEDPPGDLAEVLPPAAALLDRLDTALGRATAPEPPAETPGAAAPATSPETAVETGAGRFFRVDMDRMRRLEEAFAEVLVFQPQLDGVGERSQRLREQFREVVDEELRLRRRLGSFLYRAAENQEHVRAASYVNFMGQQVRQLARRVAALEQEQRRLIQGMDQRMEKLDEELHALQVTQAGEVLSGLRAMVLELAAELQRPVDFQITGFDLEMDRRTLQRLRGPLIHMLRNALDHGIETPAERSSLGKPPRAVIRLALALVSGQYQLTVSDDGRGLPTALIRRRAVEGGFLNEEAASRLDDHALHQLILHPRFSTARQVSQVSGRGMGLSTLAEALRDLNGSLEIQSQMGRGTTFTMRVPVSRSGSSVLLLECAGSIYGVPGRWVDRVLHLPPDRLGEGPHGLHFDSPNGPVRVQSLGALLGRGEATLGRGPSHVPLVLIRREDGVSAWAVDAVLGQRRTVLRELPPLAARSPYFSSGIPLEDGRFGLLLEVSRLLESDRGSARWGEAAAAPTAPGRPARPVILVVDDSYTSRTLEAGVIESSGYQVLQAADGLDGLRVLRNEHVDLIICDIEMPRLDGFGMLAEVKASERLRDIPFILISSLEDPGIIQKGLSLGADSYIVKRHFEHGELVATIEHFL